jgi:predicted acylesterase/phospholipase RssA
MVKRILSISGGGTRGLVPLFYLKHLEEDLQMQFGKSLQDVFDIYAGTSIGALIISTIAYNDNYKSFSEIVDTWFKDENIIKIFTETNYMGYVGMAPKYKGLAKTSIIKEVHGNKTLSETSKNKIAMFALYSITHQRPKFIKSYKNYSKCTLLSEIIDCSSAASGYFPSKSYTKCNKEHWAIDGALCNLNDPTDYAYCETLRLYPKEHLQILSLGTGADELASQGPETQSYGFVKWAPQVFGIMYTSGQELADYKTKSFAKALGHDYIRVNKDLNVALDDITKIDFLKKTAKEWYDETKDKVLSMLSKDFTNNAGPESSLTELQRNQLKDSENVLIKTSSAIRDCECRTYQTDSEEEPESSKI